MSGSNIHVSARETPQAGFLGKAMAIAFLGMLASVFGISLSLCFFLFLQWVL